ncbi:MAG: transcriptional regulator NrdR [Phycisphaerae bacterium]
MLCPACKEDNNKVIDSRLTESGQAIRRRRRCIACNRRFTTKERIEEELRLTVAKSSGRRVPYNRENVFKGVQRACCKLDIGEADIEGVVDRVEEELFANHERECSTEAIGRYVGIHLRRLSQVAYVRFMSVYRKYQTVGEFIDEISNVRAEVAKDSPDQQSLF